MITPSKSISSHEVYTLMQLEVLQEWAALTERIYRNAIFIRLNNIIYSKMSVEVCNEMRMAVSNDLRRLQRGIK